MKNKTQGIIALVISGVGLVRWLTAEPVGNGAYASGRSGGMLFACVIFLLAGLYFFFKKE